MLEVSNMVGVMVGRKQDCLDAWLWFLWAKNTSVEELPVGVLCLSGDFETISVEVINRLEANAKPDTWRDPSLRRLQC